MRSKPALSNKLAALLVMLVMLACNVPSSVINTLAPGGTWYVDKTGNDGNDCLSATSACLTITAAVSKVLTGGVIQVGSGTFEEISASVPETGLYIHNKVLTLQGVATSGVPETILSGARARTAVVVQGSAILIFQDLIIQDGGGSAGIGLKIEGSSGSTAGVSLTNIIIRSNAQDGLLITGRAPVTLDDVQVLTNGRFGLYNSSTHLTIKNSIFSGNTHGAIHNYIGGKMVISDTAISDNGSIEGAIENQGDMKIERSAISGTLGRFGYPDLGGAGIYSRGSLTMVNTTVAANSGVGIEMAGGDLNMNYSTVAENGASGLKLTYGSIVMYNSIIENNASKDCDAVWTSPVRVAALWSDNLSDGTCGGDPYPSPDPYLGPLADNGGPTQTMALTWGSPAINRTGGPGVDPDTDQRGFPRPGLDDGGTADKGAYEFDRSSAVLPLVIATVETTTIETANEAQSGGATGVVPLYTDTPAPKAPITLIFTKNAFCRKGPGALYRDVSGFKQGDTAQVDGRNEDDPRWWWVQIPNSTEHCWVSYVTVVPNDLAEGLPTQTVSLELPEIPSNFVISDRVCLKNEFSIKLAWTTSNGAEGYSLYRNGEQIATFKANRTVYQENLPVNQSYYYELEAFNDNGFSERLAVEDSGVC